MKKLIALILILVITSFVVVSNEEDPLIVKISNDKIFHPNPKNKNWEYVKDRLFDGETENVYRLQGPILIDLTNATKQDSLAVEESIKQLRTILPHKTIDYFKNFVGKSIENIKDNDYNKNFKEFDLHGLLGSTIKIKFSTVIQDSRYRVTKTDDDNQIGRTEITKYEGYNHNDQSIIFNFDQAIPYKKRKQYIQYELLRTLSYINPAKIYAIDHTEMGVFNTPDFIPDQAQFNELDKFLLQKLYSDDFIDEFKDYMYANYPWRYASSFINKKIHEFKVWGIIIALGMLSFVLIFSYFQNKKFKYSYLDYFFPIFLIWLYSTNFLALFSYLTKFNSLLTWESIIFHQIPVAVIISILMSFALWGLEKICLKGKENFSYQLILKVSFTFIIFIFPMALLVITNSERKGMLEFVFPYVFFV